MHCKRGQRTIWGLLGDYHCHLRTSSWPRPAKLHTWIVHVVLLFLDRISVSVFHHGSITRVVRCDSLCVENYRSGLRTSRCWRSDQISVQSWKLNSNSRDTGHSLVRLPIHRAWRCVCVRGHAYPVTSPSLGTPGLPPRGVSGERPDLAAVD